MNNALVVGPLVVPHSLLLGLAAVAAALWVAKRRERQSGIAIETVLWRTLLVGLVVARLGFVWEFRAPYFAAPLDILDVRDGGFSPTAGFVGAWLYALSHRGRVAGFRKSLAAALMTATVIWTAGSTLLWASPETGQEMPALGFTSLEGRPVNLADFKGRPTVINLWATWCPPCVREMPTLQRAQLDHPGVNFVFVNQGESGAKVSAWLQARQLTMRHVLLDGNRQAAAAFKQSALPTTLFFDAQGRLASTRIGELSAATLEQKLQALAR